MFQSKPEQVVMTNIPIFTPAVGARVSVLLLLLWAAVAQADDFTRSVLYINSYHDGYRWSDGELAGIRSELANSPYKVDLQIEYMDAKKFTGPVVEEQLLRLYLQKFTPDGFDVVIVSDDDAFTFALSHRQTLFPEVPLVFCGVNDPSPEKLARGNLTGVVESFDLGGTIELALQLHPEKKRMIVVGDDSTAGLAIKRQIEQLVPAFSDRLQVDYWAELELAEVQRRVGRLDDDAFLFFIPYYQVIGNHFYTAEEVMAAIYSHTTVPIYTAWEFLLGNGAIGGSLLSGPEHGQAAARMALQLFSGTPAGEIPIQFNPAGVYMFDYQVMQRLGINQNLLPRGSRLINAPNPFYELPRELFWTIMVSFITLLLVLVILSFNMAARRKVERKIKEQLAFQETLIDTIPQLVSWKDHQGRYVGANRTFAAFFGLERISAVVGKFTEDVVFDRDYARWSQRADQAVIREKRSFRKVQRRIVDRDGNDFWLEINKVPLKGEDNRVSGVLSTAENITRERNLERQLLQSQKMEAIGTLAGGIAHDFNNILTSIINSTELAIADVEVASQTEKDLQRVLRAARRGGSVVKQILAFSRPSQEGFRPTDLKSVLTEVIGLMEVSLPGNVEMRSYIAPGLPAVHADPTQLNQAVMNLCTNSFQELRRTGGVIQLRLEEAELEPEESGYLDLQPGRYLKISVIDDGPGIDPAIVDKIFDPFFTSKDKSEGTGLGLTVVHGIVKGHGGGIRVRSEIGRGAAFEIFLPRTHTASPPETLEVAGQESRGGRILFVEDDIDQLQSVRRILRSFGFQVEAVSDSEEAATLVAAGSSFDLVITDYDMPGCTGVELARRIGERFPNLPVVLVSGREDAVAAAAGVETIAKVLMKPYGKAELRALITSILSRD